MLVINTQQLLSVLSAPPTCRTNNTDTLLYLGTALCLPKEKMLLFFHDDKSFCQNQFRQFIIVSELILLWYDS